ncbi:MAG: lysophospholipid acyltransferase family protein [Phycisphaerae bacterium]
MKTRGAWSDQLQYAAVRLVVLFLSMFPLETSLRAMRWLGAVWCDLPEALPDSRVPPRIARLRFMRWAVRLSDAGNRLLSRFREHRRRAERHIRLAFPDLDDAAVSSMARASMQQLAMLAVEVLLTPRLITPWTWARHITLHRLDEAIRALLARKGCIMLTAHYGNWELLGYALATLGFDVVAVMRPLDNPYLNRYLLERRERSGLRLLYKKGASRSAAEVLESGGALCFIADQNAGRKGLFVDFFGRKASTYKSIGLLAMAHDVPIIVGCARRRSRRFEYEVCVNRIIRPEEWRDREDPLMWITQAYSRAMEDFIRVAPEQYLWIHRRWKTRPKEERLALEAETSRANA